MNVILTQDVENLGQKGEVVSLLARVRIRSEDEVAALEAQERAQAEAAARQMQFQHAEIGRAHV